MLAWRWGDLLALLTTQRHPNSGCVWLQHKSGAENVIGFHRWGVIASSGLRATFLLGLVSLLSLRRQVYHQPRSLLADVIARILLAFDWRADRRPNNPHSWLNCAGVWPNICWRDGFAFGEVLGRMKWLIDGRMCSWVNNLNGKRTHSRLGMHVNEEIGEQIGKWARESKFYRLIKKPQVREHWCSIQSTKNRLVWRHCQALERKPEFIR